MNKKLLIIIVIAVIAIGGGIYYFSSRQSLYNNTQPRINANTGNSNVTISNFSFNPAEITIKQGGKVLWVNNDLAGHLVNANDNSFVSEVLSQGATFEHTFSVKGVFLYHCKIHPSMSGKVIVE